MRKFFNLCCKPIHNQAFLYSTLAPKLSPEHQIPSFRQLRHKRREFADLLAFPTVSEELRGSYYSKIYAQILVSGLHSDTFLANVLLNSYSRSGCISYARLLFDKMSNRNLISWSTVITMYAQHAYYHEALLIFLEFLRCSDESPNEYILATVVRACGQTDGFCSGFQVHAFIIKFGLKHDVYVGTSVVDFYSKLGNICAARLVFDELPVKNSVTWTSILTGYTKSGQSHVTLELFYEMRDDDRLVPDRYVISCLLNACSMLQSLQQGKQTHAQVLRRGAEMDISVQNVLLDFYSKCGRMKSARNLFSQITTKNLITWTTMIAGCMQNSCHSDAMELFYDMTSVGLKPDGFACTSILTSCGSLEALWQGKEVHAYAIKANLETDEFVKNGLVDMYSKCDSLNDAQRAFDTLCETCIVSYNAIIEGYSRRGRLLEGLDHFRKMRLKMLQPNLLTFVSLLGAASNAFALDLSRQVHALTIKFGVSSHLFTSSSLIDVYSKCSSIKDARFVFNEVNHKDLVVWNTMFTGYTQHMENEEALKLYPSMQATGEKPNEFTFVALLTAASNLTSLQHGQQFHAQLTKSSLDLDPFVVNALVDMYAKCGGLVEARKAFESASWRDIPCWNSLITTYASHGKAHEALSIYEKMLRDGMSPNYVTFIGVLSACSHAGLVETGLSHFESMNNYGVQPGIEHYACVVSLFGRAGKLLEAMEFIERMPILPAPILWRSLLSACREVGNTELGAYAAEKATEVDPFDSGSYTLLSNIYASRGMWHDVKRVRKRMETSGVVKEPGCSWIELSDQVHVFIAKDNSHSESRIIFSVLDGLVEQMRAVRCGVDSNMVCGSR